jgi:hypothetical protein
MTKKRNLFQENLKSTVLGPKVGFWLVGGMCDFIKIGSVSPTFFHFNQKKQNLIHFHLHSWLYICLHFKLQIYNTIFFKKRCAVKKFKQYLYNKL